MPFYLVHYVSFGSEYSEFIPYWFKSNSTSCSPNIKVDSDTIRVYNANSIELSDGVMLTRGSMIFIALLSGGDYDTVSI